MEAISSEPVLVEVVRSGVVESWHRGSAVLLSPDGAVRRAAGDPDRPIYPRSANKAMQAVAMLRAGLDLPDDLLALTAASHSGEPSHVEGVRRILAGAGLDESALANTADLPYGQAAGHAHLRAGGGPERVLHNCSGKHASMVATCVRNGWPVEGYLDPAHPVQQAITATIEELAGVPVAHIGVDGCGAPAHVLPLTALARAQQRIVAASDATPEGRVARAMRAHPEMVGGSGREVTRAMQSVVGLLAKEGAEGVLVVATADGHSFAMKLSDGSSRATMGVALGWLSGAGVDVGAGDRRWSRRGTRVRRRRCRRAGTGGPMTTSVAAGEEHHAPTTGAGAGGRDRFLDLLRTVSVSRVVLLHVLTRPPIVYLPWIQWIYPGMPEVFFVSGAVMAVSLAKREAGTVVRGRLRRLLPPFVPYAFVALAVMRVTDMRTADPAATLRWGDVSTWAVPFLRAQGSETRVILWGHVWFLSAFLWLIVLAPAVMALRRRLGRWAGLEVLLPLGGFAAVIAWEKLVGSAPREEVLNVTLYGTFFVLGFSYVDGWLGRLRPRMLVVMAVVCGVGGVLTALVIEPINRKPLNELYSSHTAHLLVGAAWLFAALALAGPIRRWAEGRRLGYVGFLTQRTYTLFLWGPAANAVAVTVAKRLMPNQAAAIVVLLGLAFVVLCALTIATGWVEDWAAGRPLRLVPRWGGAAD